jgi:nicotinamidase-related amidase
MPFRLPAAESAAPAVPARAPARGPKVRVAQLPQPRLRRADALLLVVDVQEKLVPVVRFGPRVVEHAALLARGCALLKVPVVATEQNPARLGPTSEPLRSVLGQVLAERAQGAPAQGAAEPHAKMQFSAATPGVLREVESLARPSILLCGLESHVCVLQSALDFLERGQRVFLVRDAISSRHVRDEEVALERMRGAGAIITTVESALLEMLGSADAPEFKSVLQLIK